ncbi:MAG: DUF3307 domain-containing protein [Bacteroidales bacterium]
MQYIWFLVILFIVHYLGDFFIQVYAWKNTTKWLKNLLIHTITYIFVLIFGIIVLESVFPNLTVHYHDLLGFILVNFVLHFFTDMTTKKLTRILKNHNELTAYVNVVALDQMIHYITLLITFELFFM